MTAACQFQTKFLVDISYVILKTCQTWNMLCVYQAKSRVNYWVIIMSVRKNQPKKTLAQSPISFLLHMFFPPVPWSTWDIFGKRLEKDKNLEGCDIYIFLYCLYQVIFWYAFLYLSKFIHSSMYTVSYQSISNIDLSTCSCHLLIYVAHIVMKVWKPRSSIWTSKLYWLLHKWQPLKISWWIHPDYFALKHFPKNT